MKAALSCACTTSTRTGWFMCKCRCRAASLCGAAIWPSRGCPARARRSPWTSRALGAITGRLLPTGNAMDVIDVEGLGPVELSVVDGANLAIYVQPGVLRMTGLETPDEIDADAGLRSRIDAIRKAVAYRCGLRGYWDARQ